MSAYAGLRALLRLACPFVVALLAAVLAMAPAGAQGPTIRALRLSEAQVRELRLDGLLHESWWRDAQPAAGFRQREPVEGAPATEETEVRVAYDGSTLYVGVEARMRDPSRVIARILQRDRLMEMSLDGRPRFAGDDAVALVIDPFHDHRNALVVATNPNGAEFDAQITDEGREFNIDWRGVWRVEARRTDQGWSAEFAIPFRTLRYPSGSSAPWGFNVYRVVRSTNEEMLWSAWSRDNEGFTRVSRAGHVDGLADLPRPGLNLEVKPYALTERSRALLASGGADEGGRLDAGLDAKYEVRPGLTLDATLNTDFAQVEADDEQVNLTRFDLFFPEKRDFFLENAGIFEFGVRGSFEPPPFLLFFSRRIGIAEDGVIPVLGGARLTGRVGRQTVGFLNVVTEAALGEPRTNFAVARVKRDVGGANFVGAMVVDRRGGEAANTSGGVDFSVWPTGTLNVQGFAARTSTRGPGGDDGAYRAAVDYQRDRFGISAQHLAIGPEAKPQTGFVTRLDARRTDGFSRLTLRPRVLGLRKVDQYTFAQYVAGMDGRFQERGIGPALSLEWEGGESLTLFYLDGLVRLAPEDSFPLTDEITIYGADYRSGQLGWFASTSPSRALVLGSMGMVQEFFGGRLVSAGGTVSLAVGSHLAVRLGYTRNDVDLRAGAFAADVGSVRVSYALSPRLAANMLVQYNSLDRTVSANARVSYTYRPGSDFFVVFNEQRGSSLSPWDFSSRGAIVKLTYLARL